MESRSTPVTEKEYISNEIVCAVADAKDLAPTTLSPLYDVIDPDALNSLLSHGREDCEITFRYESCSVSVGSEQIEVSHVNTDGDRATMTED